MGGSNGMFDPGNVGVASPYRISGRSGVLTGLSAGNPVVRLAQLGMFVRSIDDTLRATPIRISQIRLKYAPRTSPATGAVFEILKGTGTPATTGGTAHAAQRRKTSGYPAIATTETHLYVADTGLISGGTFAALDDTAPIDMVSVGIVDVGSGVAVWSPSDLCGEVLEAGEALEVRAVAQSGTGILLAAFDFLR